jgi:O-antigen/teichoic acid export membrane protein
MPDSTLSRLVRGTFSVGIGNVATMVLGLVSTVVVARQLPAESFGSFILLLVTATLLARVSSFGLDIAMPKFLAGAEDEAYRRALFNTVVLFRLITIAFVSVLALAVRLWLPAALGGPALADLVALVPLLFLLISLGQLLRSALQGFMLFRAIALTDALGSLLNLLLILAFTTYLDLGLAGLIYAKALSLAVVAAIAYAQAPVTKALEFSPAILRPVLRFGFPLQLNDVLTFAYQRIDILLIGLLIGPLGVAYYEIARKIPESLNSLYDAFHSVYLPLVARLHATGEKDRVAAALNHSLRLLSFAGLAGALAAIAVSPQVFTLLFSARYLPSVPAFNILMVMLVFTFIDSLLGYSLVAIGDSAKPPIINTVRVLIVFACYAALIPAFGIAGAALAGLVGVAATNPLSLLFLRRNGIAVEFGVYGKPILAFAACLAPIFLFPANVMLVGPLMVALFLAFGVISSTIQASDVTAIKDEMRSIMLSRMSTR